MKIIEYSLRYRPNAKWICHQSGLPWLKLDIPVPYADILAEWQGVSDQAVDHRAGDYAHQGWQSLVLYGASPTATMDDTGPHSWTSVAEQCPKTIRWINDNFIIDTNTGRIRFMLLKAGGHISLHRDREDKRLNEINVAISNPKENIFRFIDYGTVPFENGSAYMLDLSNKHIVANQSDKDRLHIILHTKVDDSIIEKSYAHRYNH